VQAVEAALHLSGAPVTRANLAKQFKRAQPADVAEILETLVTLGRARKQGDRFSR
jgi:chromosome segregation and condensation protein ScpB